MCIEERAHCPSANAGGRHLAVRHRDWASEGIGEAIIMHTLWIMRWKENDSMGSKINRSSLVEAGRDILMGDRGEEEWKTISIAQWWVVMKDKFLLRVLAIPIEIWEILMAWNQGIQAQRKKLRIGSTGGAGLGDPEINALCDVIEAQVGDNSI